MEPLQYADETNKTNCNFLRVSGLNQIIKSLRKIFSINYDFPSLTYSIQKKKKIIQPELGELSTSHLLKNLSDSKEVNKKGSKSVLWINAKPGEHEGLISDTFIDFIITSQLSPELKNFLSYNGASKFYLLKGYKIGKQTGSLEPVFISPNSIRNSYWNELILMPIWIHQMI